MERRGFGSKMAEGISLKWTCRFGQEIGVGMKLERGREWEAGSLSIGMGDTWKELNWRGEVQMGEMEMEVGLKESKKKWEMGEGEGGRRGGKEEKRVGTWKWA